MSASDATERRSIALLILGPPQPKQRARRGAGGRWYTPKATRDFERAVAAACLEARMRRRGSWPTSGAEFEVRVVAYMPDRRPRDVDNVAKSVLDGIQRARCIWRDDRQVKRLVVSRELDREDPRTEVVVEVLA